ncbi:Metallo-peptidase family M12-domain-containing protein [Sporodiniella umbellata]|nr:Metallo-peptidase family M12-domain-containing protein [Sporodiniella umbellata]
MSANLDHKPHANSIEYDDSLRITVEAFNQTFYLHLTPNDDLFHPKATIHQNGISTPLDRTQFMVYQGFTVDNVYSDYYMNKRIVEHQPGIIGWARIVIRNDIKNDILGHPVFEGSFSFYGDIYHIKLNDVYQRTKRAEDVNHNPQEPLIIYRDSDKAILRQANTAQCGSEALHQTKKDSLIYENLFNIKQKSSPFDIFSKRALPTGCPTSKKMLYMGVAADCTYTKFYKTTDGARMQIINNWNSVSSVYASSFNVGIGLINITIMDSSCPTTTTTPSWNQVCSTSYSISQRLSDFSKWRGAIGDDGAGLWHLMTTCATGPEVGIAWLGVVCNHGSSAENGQYTSGTGVSSVITDEWKVVAHEIGHGFGAIHDCNSQTCPCSGPSCNCCPYSSTQCDAGGKYFMNPTSNASSSEFSPCSISKICNNIPMYSSCLENPGSRNTTTLKMCGNGIKEQGEDCDTGGKPSACCDPKTCKFKTGALCDDLNDLCCTNCQFRPANYTCRPASTECDIAEVCLGNSGDCPEDKYKDDLTNCGNGLQCASGQCTSRDAQCISRGTTYHIQKSCSNYDGCQVTCQDPSSSFACIAFPGYFSDGTPCGIGGVCNAGKCDLKNFGNNINQWINTHKNIFIPVVIIAGLLLLCCLYSCCCYSGQAPYHNVGSTVVITQPPPYYPPPQPTYYQPSPPQGWVNPAAYNGHVQTPVPAYPRPDVYEMNNANNWQHHTDSPQGNYTNRRYNEGLI